MRAITRPPARSSSTVAAPAKVDRCTPLLFAARPRATTLPAAPRARVTRRSFLLCAGVLFPMPARSDTICRVPEVREFTSTLNADHGTRGATRAHPRRAPATGRRSADGARSPERHACREAGRRRVDAGARAPAGQSPASESSSPPPPRPRRRRCATARSRACHRIRRTTRPLLSIPGGSTPRCATGLPTSRSCAAPRPSSSAGRGDPRHPRRRDAFGRNTGTFCVRRARDHRLRRSPPPDCDHFREEFRPAAFERAPPRPAGDPRFLLPARSACRSSCRRAIAATPSTTTRTAAPTCSTARPTRSAASRASCSSPAGSQARRALLPVRSAARARGAVRHRPVAQPGHRGAAQGRREVPRRRTRARGLRAIVALPGTRKQPTQYARRLRELRGRHAVQPLDVLRRGRAAG